MFKMKFTAVLLCLTMVFAMFTGGVYAEDGFVYVGDTTIVIEDGKVVSGDKSLVDKGIIVIGDELDDGTGEDTRPNEIAPDNTPADFTEDYSAAEENGVDADTNDRVDTSADSGKAPVKDNSSLLQPEQVVTPSVPSTILPEETPTAVNPNNPSESVKDNIITASCMGYSDNSLSNENITNGKLYFGEWKNDSGTSNILVYATQKVAHVSGNRVTYTFNVRRTGTYASVASGRFYRGNGTLKSGDVNFKGDMFEVEAGKTLTFNGESDYRIYIDGRRVNFDQGSGASINDKINNKNFDSGKNTGRLLDVYGTSTLNYVTLRNNSTTANGAGIVVRKGGVVTLNNCTIDNCDSDGKGGGIYVEAGGKLTLDTVTIQNCNANKGGAIYVAGAATITLKGTVKIGGTGAGNANSATDGGNVYIAAGSFTLPAGCYINDGVADHGGGVYIETGTFNLAGGAVGWNNANHGGGVYVTNGTFNMTSGTVYENKATRISTGAGGGIRTPDPLSDENILDYQGVIKITGGSIYNNQSSLNGGGMWIGSVKEFKMSNCQVYNNVSGRRGGGLFFNRPTETPIEITGDTGVVRIYENKAAVSGAGLVFGNYKGNISAVIGSVPDSSGNVTNRVFIYNNTVTGGSLDDPDNIESGCGGGIHLMDDASGTVSLTIRHADIYGNTATVYGGGIFLSSEAVLTMGGGSIGSGTISEANTAPNGGGVAMVEGSAFNFNGGSIKYNTASQNGGGIYSEGQTTLCIRGGAIIYNEAAENGGGIYAKGPNANGISIMGEVYSVQIHHNKANDTGNGGGGGICISNHKTEGEDKEKPVTGMVIGGGAKVVEIYENQALYGGGIRFLNSGYGLLELEIKSNVKIYTNRSTASETATYKGGGGIFVGGNSSLVIDGAEIYQNVAAFYGAGMVIAGGSVTMKSGSIYGHTVTHNGAAIKMVTSGSFTMEGGEIYNNTADNGGAIHLDDARHSVVLSGGTVRNNTSTSTVGGGGAVAQGGGSVTVSGATLLDNTAYHGGGIYCNGGTLTVSGGFITSNDATYGGGIHVDQNDNKTKTVLFSGGTINENTAVYNGAGVWIGEFESFTMENTVVDSNHAGRIGAGLFFNRGSAENTLLIKSGTISNNRTDSADNAANVTASSQFLGGGIYLGNGGQGQYSCHAVFGGGDAPLNIFGNSSPRGGGICVDDGAGQPVTVILNSGVNIYGNEATDTIASGMGGGGIYISESGIVTMNEGVTIGGTSTENGNTAKYGAGVQINGGTFTQNGGSIRYNTATYYGGGVHVIETTFVMNGGTNTGNVVIDGMGGGVYVATNSRFELEDGAVLTENKANYGGGVYVKGVFAMNGGSIGDTKTTPNLANYGGGLCVAEGATATMSGGSIQNNVYTGDTVYKMSYGGGVCVFGTFTMTGGAITGNEATGSGGGIIIDEHNDTDTPTASFVMTGGSVTNNNNTATTDAGNGGGIWVGTCITFKIEGTGTNNPVISGNTTSGEKANANGAGIFINRSISNAAVIKNCTVSGNTCNGNQSKGGGICIGSAGVINANTYSIENVTISGNTAATGAGVFINGGSASNSKALFVGFNNLSLTGNTATAGSGGGIRLAAANVTASGLTLTDNSAVSGGGIAVTNGGAFTASNTLVASNEASGTFTGETNYLINGAEGTGGGVVVYGNGSSFTLTSGGIYNNVASTAGDDVFAAGDGTKLGLPAASAIDTSELYKENAEDVYCWVEDYMTGDTSYASGLNGSNGRIVMRYRETPASVRAFVNDSEGISPDNKYVNDNGRFVAITFGVPKYNVGSVTITAPQSDDPNQRFVFTLSGVNTLGETINITVSALGGQTVKITELMSGTYTVVQEDSWSWRYDFDTVKVDSGAESETNSVTVTITGTELEEVHTVEYTNELTNNRWLTHNSEVEVNIPPNPVGDAPVTAARVFILPEDKRTLL